MGLFSWFKKGGGARDEGAARVPEPEIPRETVDELAEALASPDGAARGQVGPR